MSAVERDVDMRGRSGTETKLEAAALRLLDRDGVLSGLNLREVADEAGVNRALVYRYFGSRRELLREAYKRAADRIRTRYIPQVEAPIRERYRFAAEEFIDRNRDWARIVLLLALDRDEEFKAMEYGEEVVAALHRDRDSGVLDADVDPEAMHAFFFSALAGFAVLREQLARDLGVPVTALDTRVHGFIDHLVATLTRD